MTQNERPFRLTFEDETEDSGFHVRREDFLSCAFALIEKGPLTERTVVIALVADAVVQGSIGVTDEEKAAAVTLLRSLGSVPTAASPLVEEALQALG